ncbi:MAG: tetratricopeptide repeat protein [Phycisphaerales bacterium]|nr:tetratricopeptide repeat protein [Phycisphaerales bacterium]
MNRGTDWIRWILMAVLAGVAVYFFLFTARGLAPAPTPSPEQVLDPILKRTIQLQLNNIEQNPSSLDERLKLGMLYEANELDDLALASYQQLTDVVPEHPRAWYQTGLILDKRGQSTEAMAAMRESVRHAGKIPFPSWRLGLMLLAAERPEEALPALEAARNELGDDPTLMAMVMRAQVDAGNAEAALGVEATHRLTETSLAPYIHQLLERAHDMLGNSEEAEKSRVLASTGLPPMGNSWELEVSRMRMGIPVLKIQISNAVRAQKWEQAMAMLDNLRQYEEPTKEVLLLEATCLARTGSPEEALNQLDRMLEAEPDDRPIIVARSNVQLDLASARNEPAQAEAALAAAERLLELNAADSAAHSICMRALETLGRPEEAIGACRAHWKTSSGAIEPLHLASMLIARHELWKDNEDLLRSLWMNVPNHPAAGSLLVLSLAEQGRTDEARQILSGLTSASLNGEFLGKARIAVESAD